MKYSQRKPSKTPYTRSWPLDRERGTDHTNGYPPPPAPDMPTRDSSRKSYINEPHWLTKFVRAFFRYSAQPEIIPTDTPPPPDPHITPTTSIGNYPSTQETLKKEYDEKLTEWNKG